MTVLVNGQARTVAKGATVEQLLESLGLRGQPCGVEINKQLVPKRRHAETILAEGDHIEIVTLVGGG